MKILICCLALTIMLVSFKIGYHWDVPVDKETNKITFEGQLNERNLNKEAIFRRIKKFIAVRDFDKVENIKCKNGSIITTKFYEKSIRYEDFNDGIFIGSGYIPIIWRKFNYLWIVFDYKIMAKEGQCKYQFSNYKTINFLSASKARTRGSAFGTGGYGYIYGSSGSSTIISSNKIQQVSLEDYILGKGEKDSYNTYLRENPELFLNAMESIQRDLANSIKNEF